MKTISIDFLNPKSCISGQIMSANRIIAKIFRKHLKPFGITDSQLSILFVASKHKVLKQKDIADILFMEKSTVNRNITRLVDNNYLAFQDRFYISITDEGKILVNKILPHWNLAMNEVSDILGQDGVSALSSITNKLSTEVNK